jgi:hypothetical protein
MLITLLSALIVSLVSGLAFIAINHIKIFEEISVHLTIAIVLVTVFILGYDYGVFRLSTEVFLSPNNKYSSINENLPSIVEKQYIPFTCSMLISAISLSYLRFLTWLGNEIDKKKKTKPKKEMS